MADDVVLNPGAGGDTIAADDVGGVKYQVVKLAVGADGAAALVANANPIPISDAGGTLTVDGTVELGATALAALETITVASLSAAIPAGNNNIGDVDIASIAAGDNNIGNVDVLTVPADPFGANADAASATGSISAKLRFIASTGIPVTGTVTVGSHAVTNAGTFVTQENGPALTALQLIDDTVFAEDTAAQAADKGIAILAVRRDADTSLVGADNDYANLQVNASGSLKVAITAGAGSGGTSIADGASFTRDTTSITPVGAAVESSAPTLTNGDVAALSMTTGGALRVAVASGGITGVVEDAASSGGEEGVLVMAVRRDTAASSSGTDGDYSTLNTDASGRLHVNVGALPNSTNTIEVVGDVAQDAAVGGNPVLVGLRASTATPSAMSADGDSVHAWGDRNGATIVTGRLVDDAAFTPGTDRVVPMGLQADETATDSVDEGDIGCPRITLDRKQIVTPYVHAAAGGHTPYYNLDCDETEDAIKASAGKLFWIHVMNLSNAVRYIKFYNDTVANVTVGTTTPVLSFPVPTMADTNGAGFAIHFGDAGVAFSAAITVAATTGLADNSTGAPGANEVVLNAGFI